MHERINIIKTHEWTNKRINKYCECTNEWTNLKTFEISKISKNNENSKNSRTDNSLWFHKNFITWYVIFRLCCIWVYILLYSANIIINHLRRTSWFFCLKCKFSRLNKRKNQDLNIFEIFQLYIIGIAERQ